MYDVLSVEFQRHHAPTNLYLCNQHTMDLSTLARRQKRALDWLTALESEPTQSSIRTEFAELLGRYQELLWQIAEAKNASSEQIDDLDALERRLTDCNDLVRLAAAERNSGSR